MKKTIFFDFNGTIIDDLNLCLDILNVMLKNNGQKPIDIDMYKEIFTFPIIDYYVKAGFDFKKKSFELLSIDFINMYQEASYNCNLHEGVLDALKYFKEKGYRLVVLSASQIDNLKEQLDEFGITKYFDRILGIENIYAKSKVEIGVNYIKEENLNKDECIMIGDTLHDEEVAHAMGIDVVLYDKGHQSHNVLSKGNSKVVSSFEEFITIIETQF